MRRMAALVCWSSQRVHSSCVHTRLNLSVARACNGTLLAPSAGSEAASHGKRSSTSGHSDSVTERADTSTIAPSCPRSPSRSRPPQIQIPCYAANALPLVEHQADRIRFEVVIESPARPALGCGCHRSGHRIPRKEDVHETGSSPLRMRRSVRADPWKSDDTRPCR
jgi:hypothetical protein